MFDSQAVEVLAAETHRLDRVERGDRRAARARRDQHELAEDVAGTEDPEDSPISLRRVATRNET